MIKYILSLKDKFSSFLKKREKTLLKLFLASCFLCPYTVIFLYSPIMENIKKDLPPLPSVDLNVYFFYVLLLLIPFCFFLTFKSFAGKYEVSWVKTSLRFFTFILTLEGLVVMPLAAALVCYLALSLLVLFFTVIFAVF